MSLEAANVSGATARKGNGVRKAIEGTEVEMLSRVVHEVVLEKVGRAAMDGYGGYSWPKPIKRPRQSVGHQADESAVPGAT